MLTPAKIKNHHFEASGRNSYKIDSVDSFFEEVSESYERMFQENTEMFKKLNLLAERLEEYKKDEDNIRNILLTAQRTAEKITAEAKEKADALVAEVTERTQNEHARLDETASEILSKAKEKADAIVSQARSEADRIIDEATRDSKEAAISARSAMIKEEAALEMMKAEVTKFKSQLIEQYSEQLGLIEKLPEFIYEKFEEAQEEEQLDEKLPEEEAVEEVQEQAEQTVEVSDENEDDDVKVVAIISENVELDGVSEEDLPVDTLQQMIDEDDEADDDSDEDEPTEIAEKTDEEVKFVLPEIDEATDEDLDKIVEDYDDKPSATPDIMFTKPRRPQQPEEGFKVDVEKISVYSDKKEDGIDNYLDEYDDEDDDLNDDDGGSLADKIKGFFKK